MLLKKYCDFGGGKKKSDSKFLSYKLMLIPENNFVLYATKLINILTRLLSEKKF